jgi:hypothetical protein
MKFDKSKVCVAGLHEVKEGTKGWFAKNIKRLCDRVERNDCMSIVRSTTAEGFECFEGDLFPFFYPAQEKQYRPFETTEEARVLMGKLIRHKYDTELFMVVTISVEGFSGLSINGYNTDYLWDNFVIDETGEPVGVEI